MTLLTQFLLLANLIYASSWNINHSWNKIITRHLHEHGNNGHKMAHMRMPSFTKPKRWMLLKQRGGGQTQTSTGPSQSQSQSGSSSSFPPPPALRKTQVLNVWHRPDEDISVSGKNRRKRNRNGRLSKLPRPLRVMRRRRRKAGSSSTATATSTSTSTSTITSSSSSTATSSSTSSVGSEPFYQYENLEEDSMSTGIYIEYPPSKSTSSSSSSSSSSSLEEPTSLDISSETYAPQEELQNLQEDLQVDLQQVSIDTPSSTSGSIPKKTSKTAAFKAIPSILTNTKLNTQSNTSININSNINSNTNTKSKIKQEPIIIQNVQQLRSAILDHGHDLKDVAFDVPNFKSINKAKNLHVEDSATVKTMKGISGGRVSVVSRKIGKKRGGKGKAGQLEKDLNMSVDVNVDVNVDLNVDIDSNDPMKGYESDTSTMTEKVLPASTYKSKETPPSSSSSTSTQQAQQDLQQIFTHEVLSLLQQRAATNSKPGHRAPNDKAHLALSIEGGGMRGAVSAGMIGAIASLGLADAFDSVYGSSAGSVVGAYLISRQVCVDVYTDILTTAKTRFVSKTKLVGWIARHLFDTTVIKKKTRMTKDLVPAMNISFVLDEIMCPQNGLRPLDLDAFHANDQHQPLRIVTSSVKDGQMETTCFGSKEMDFVPGQVALDDSNTTHYTTQNIDGTRKGLFACLETSMTVPAAAGQPKDLLRLQDVCTNMTTTCFDAFCYEPIPYRSAVEEGATHVLVLKTRPDQSPIGTEPGIFEKVVAPMYFDAHNMTQVSRYFEKGGQQYVYVEDYLTLEEAKSCTHEEGMLVPPAKLLYGVESTDEIEELIQHRDLEWKRAHLLPIAVPDGEPELSTLSVDKEEVLRAVRQGFAAAFDMLAPTVGIELNDTNMNGKRVAEIMFPSLQASKYALKQQVPIAGDLIHDEREEGDDLSDVEGEVSEKTVPTSPTTVTTIPSTVSSPAMEYNVMSNLESTPMFIPRQRTPFERDHNEDATKIRKKKAQNLEPCKVLDAHMLLETLPGLRAGKLPCLSRGLHNHIMHSVNAANLVHENEE